MKPQHAQTTDSVDDRFDRLEFHREGVALFPPSKDSDPGVAISINDPRDSKHTRFCSCKRSRKKTCSHLLELINCYKAFEAQFGHQQPEKAFQSSAWFHLVSILATNQKDPPKAFQFKMAASDNHPALTVFDATGTLVLTYFAPESDQLRFLERCGKMPDQNDLPNRAAILEKLRHMTLNNHEYTMRQKGYLTRRMAFENSFLFRLGYHFFSEYDASAVHFKPMIEERSGEFYIAVEHVDGPPLVQLRVDRSLVKRFVTEFKDHLKNKQQFAIHPIPLKSVLSLSMNKNQEVAVQHLLQHMTHKGKTRYFDQSGLKKYRYGNLVYLKELSLMACLDTHLTDPPLSAQNEWLKPDQTVLDQSQIPLFLDKMAEQEDDDHILLDDQVKGLKILKTVDRVNLTPDALDHDWYWLSVDYTFGRSKISLVDLIQARKSGQRFIGTPEGWIDCFSDELDGLDPMLDWPFETKDDRLKISSLNILRLKSAIDKPLHIEKSNESARPLKKLIDFNADEDDFKIEGMVSPLRSYQEIGVKWLWFLFEHRLGGLLCDDMGLGKTHQVMALLLKLQTHDPSVPPSLVVCPTSVINHWQKKMSEHTPQLAVSIYHGNERDLSRDMETCQVLLTTYGILRRDVDLLHEYHFTLAVFDEVQYIKNAATQAYTAANTLKATLKIGLSGTPIENSLNDLKALMDLMLPGYLGSNAAFEERYQKTVEQDLNHRRRQELSRIIYPFTLRRLKETVLDELPEKIEDICTCRLSDDQVKLYQDAIQNKGQGLVQSLRNKDAAIPYIHIFALLNLLKQICNHPALVNKSIQAYDTYQSGKWDLFTELVTACLDSGQKVVVYSQYLNMIKIFENYFRQQNVGVAVLTGSSRNRGAIIDQFEQDENCRVFIGSLKAAGAGIELVAASVVIHYDRWWNAAKEDQATDRVHRIGQRRGVQVFKLVTEGTLEEKIAAIIDKKRDLMEKIVQEDDPNLLKSFSRDQLMELLSIPTRLG